MYYLHSKIFVSAEQLSCGVVDNPLQYNALSYYHTPFHCRTLQIGTKSSLESVNLWPVFYYL